VTTAAEIYYAPSARNKAAQTIALDLVLDKLFERISSPARA
jgi:hypothetical protein